MRRFFFFLEKRPKNRRFFHFIADFFGQNAPMRRVLHSCDFSMEKLVFSNFSAKNREFYRFFVDFLISDYLLQKSFPYRPKTDFSAIFRSKNPIFLSLLLTSTSLNFKYHLNKH